MLAAATFAVTLWFWHAPAAYAATFQSDGVYWAMHLTAFAAAVWLWSGLLDGSRDAARPFALATLLTTGQMGLLGALITFAGRPLYAPHFATTYAWGLTPLADQQLGGVVMWVPAGVICVPAASSWAFPQTLRRAEARRRSSGWREHERQWSAPIARPSSLVALALLAACSQSAPPAASNPDVAKPQVGATGADRQLRAE